MSRQLDVLLVAILAVGFAATGVAGWTYEPWNVASTWADTYPSCGGQRQSPIDLSDFTVTRSPDLAWSGYGTVPPAMTLTNNGHSVSLKSSGNQPRITLSDGKIFQLDNVHFHFGWTATGGSEHTICGERYAMEMHAVHKRVLGDGSPVSPVEIIVITSLFQSGDFLSVGNGGPSSCAKKCSSDAPDNALNRLVQRFPMIVQFNASYPVPPFAWSELIPKFTEDFYWYEGSLTTPPCSEVVTFFVNRQLRWVTSIQLMFFRLLLNEENQPIAANNRRLQQRNGRNVYFYKGT